MILILRASHANEFELQNYAPLIKKLNIRVVTSRHPLTPISLPTIPLWSPTDLPQFPYRRQLFNRLIGGEQWLVGLEKIVQPQDILHTAETYTPYTHQAVQLRRHGKVKKLICTCWETIPHNNEKFAQLRQWKEESYQYVDIFHAPTHRAKQALIKEGVDPKKVIVIPYGIDLSRFKPAKHKKVKKKPPIVLTVARPVAEKGYKLWQQISHDLSDMAEFRWVSNVPYTDMPNIYQQADIFFLPSLTTPTWEEQYGMVLIEAMAVGLPIVATNTGAIAEVVDKAGILVNQNIQSLSSALARLILDTKVRTLLANISLTRTKANYSHLNCVKKLSNLYKMLSI